MLGSGLRGAAGSLLPLAAYLTGAVEMFWKIGVAIGDFATGFVFSTKVWSGIAVAGLAVVLFVVSGPLRRRRVKRGEDKQGVPRPAAAAAAPGRARQAAGHPARRRHQAATAPRQTPAKARKGKNATDDDDDLGDVEDILRRHGITLEIFPPIFAALPHNSLASGVPGAMPGIASSDRSSASLVTCASRVTNYDK